MFISLNHNRKVTAVSDHPINVIGESSRRANNLAIKSLGQTLPHIYSKAEDYMNKPHSEMKVAFVCNWLTRCGISTYTKYLVDAMKPLVKEVRIFSESADELTGEDGPEVDRCWQRGGSLLPLAEKVLEWNPDYVIIQHEYGIFPNLFYFMQFMQRLENVPYAVTLHSVYEHLDKIVYSNSIKNIIVHTQQGKDILYKHGHNGNINVIPHGCFKFDQLPEVWNLCRNPYTILQFGFGFNYKGVDRALEAIAHLKDNDEKFQNIFYMYLLSENEHTRQVHSEYYLSLLQKIDELGLRDNVAILRKFQTDYMLNLYLRLAKLCIFPYINNPNNTVYAASGAARLAMSNKAPVIVSESHLFDDLEGVLPRPSNSLELAREIDEIFSNEEYKQSIIERSQQFLDDCSWNEVARMYLNVSSNKIH